MYLKLGYSSVDDQKVRPRVYTSLRGARDYAQGMLGKRPEIGGGYAVSGDGVGKIVILEGNVSLWEIFPDVAPD
jgi:hypothetical protein